VTFEYQVPSELTVTSDGPVRIVTLNRPDDLNGANRDLHRGLLEVWGQIERDRDAAAVVLTGAGRAFCAGGDFSFMKVSQVHEQARIDLMREARQLVEEMLRFRLPVLAAVNGPAVGLGTTLALCSDLVLMGPRAHLSDPHVSIGLAAGDGGAVLWPLYTSLMRVKEYLFTGKRIYPEEAVRLGLAIRAVEDDSVLEKSLELAHSIASQPRAALQFTKRALNLHAQRSLLAVGDYAASAELVNMASSEHRDAIRQLLGTETYDAIEVPEWEG